MKSPNSQNGNAIVMILIAVALFAALSYAFSNSTRTSTSLITDTEAEAYATQIINYGNEVKSAVKRLQLRGCSDTEISFENNVIAGYVNPTAPSNKKCHVFDIAGGGLDINSGLSENTQQFYGDVPFEDIGTAEPELSIQLSGLDRSVCLKINQKLNLVDSNNDDYIENIAPAPSSFNGSYGDVLITNIAGDDVGSFSKEKSFCRFDSVDYLFNSVLIAR